MPTSLTELFSPACHLCPRRCGAARDEGAHGVCGANDTLKVARAALHEPALIHHLSPAALDLARHLSQA